MISMVKSLKIYLAARTILQHMREHWILFTYKKRSSINLKKTVLTNVIESTNKIETADSNNIEQTTFLLKSAFIMEGITKVYIWILAET